MFDHLKLKASRILIAGILIIPGLAIAGMTHCANGYCPNANSPVVGGYYGPSSSSCFGNIEITSQWISFTTHAWTYSFTCPHGTASISVPGSYLADNGRWYNVNTVCVLTDTTGGWYGGEK